MAGRVLVVDDEQEIRDLLQRFLTQEGYEVVLASNGKEALELAEREEPQVILLDIKMPGLDGIKTCRRLKKGEGTRHIPIIVATAFKDRLLEALDAGADDFVVKPFHLAELSVRVRSILRVLHLKDEIDRAAAYMQELQKNLPNLQDE